jgi:hypothetical protein
LEGMRGGLRGEVGVCLGPKREVRGAMLSLAKAWAHARVAARFRKRKRGTRVANAA